MRRLVSCLVLAAGCAEPASSASGAPLLVVERGPEPGDDTAEDLAAPADRLLEHAVGLATPAPGLARPAPRVSGEEWVAVEPNDLMTATGGSPPSVVFGLASPWFVRCSRAPGCARLVELPEGREVAVDILVPEAAYGDRSRRVVLVPRAALLDRWYAVEIDVDQAVLGARRRGRVQVARFRPDSHPIVTGVLASANRDAPALDLRFSERVSGDTEASSWVVEDDSGPLDCAIDGPARGRAEQHAILAWDRRAVGRVRIELVGTLQSDLGTELVDRWDDAVTSIFFRMPEPADDDSVGSVSLFDDPT